MVHRNHPEEKMTCIVFQRRKKLHRLKCPGIHEGYPVVSQHQSQYTSGAKLCAGVVSANNAIPARPVVVLKGALCSLIITAMTVGKPSTTRYGWCAACAHQSGTADQAGVDFLKVMKMKSMAAGFRVVYSANFGVPAELQRYKLTYNLTYNWLTEVISG